MSLLVHPESIRKVLGNHKDLFKVMEILIQQRITAAFADLILAAIRSRRSAAIQANSIFTHIIYVTSPFCGRQASGPKHARTDAFPPAFPRKSEHTDPWTEKSDPRKFRASVDAQLLRAPAALDLEIRSLCANRCR